MNKFNQNYMKFLLRLHSYLYAKISYKSRKFNNNVHPKHRIMNYHQFFLDNINEESTVLDIGCGLGIVAYKIALKAKEVVAVDISKKSIQEAKRKFNRKNIEYIVADATKYDFDEVFDYIVLSNVLEHIQERIPFLKKIKHLSNTLLIRVPMINRSWLVYYKKEMGIDYRLDSTHYIEYTIPSFKNEIESAGLKIKSYDIQFGEIWAQVTLND